jgi:hypothetical protein
MMLTESGRIEVMAVLSLFWALLGIALLALAMSRFRRSRLL